MAVQFRSFGSAGCFAGNCRFPPPSSSWLEQLFPMFHGLPPFAAVLFATSVPRSVVLLPLDMPPVMPPPTQSAWLFAIVVCVMVATRARR